MSKKELFKMTLRELEKELNDAIILERETYFKYGGKSHEIKRELMNTLYYNMCNYEDIIYNEVKHVNVLEYRCVPSTIKFCLDIVDDSILSELEIIFTRGCIKLKKCNKKIDAIHWLYTIPDKLIDIIKIISSNHYNLKNVINLDMTFEEVLKII